MVGSGHPDPSLDPLAASAPHEVDFPDIEELLGEVIRSARDVAASAEELLREIALRQQVIRSGRGASPPLLLGQALAPLSASRRRLVSALEQLPLH